MAKAPRIYRRLPGRGTSLAHYVRLYQGPDHFLQVLSTGFNETYKRFYFRDIQAIIIEKKFWHLAWSAFWLMLAVPFILIALSASGTAELGFASVAGLFIALFGVNLFVGPSCLCYIQTAVQVEKLPTIKRVRAARKFIARIHAELMAAQSVFAAPEPEAAPVQEEPPTTEPQTPLSPGT